MSFANLLDLHLRSQGVALIALAGKTRLPASTLSRLRTGKRLPTEAHLAALAKALRLSTDEAARWRDAARLDRVPEDLRRRVLSAPLQRAEGFHDGWWLGLCHGFRDDGSVQRFLVRFHGDQVLIQVHDRGELRYRYPGECAMLGETIFLRASEDRGGSEHLQIVLHSIFAQREPTVLHGVVCGISPRDLNDPVSLPCAARVLLLYAGDLALPAPALRSLQSVCGSGPAATCADAWPDLLADRAAVERAINPDDAPLADAVLALIDNHIPASRSVLRGGVRAHTR